MLLKLLFSIALSFNNFEKVLWRAQHLTVLVRQSTEDKL